MEGGCWEDGIAPYPVFQGSGGGESFTKAAEQLAIAQPPLSRQIQDLEAELGTTLFLRTPHKVIPDRRGRAFPAICQSDSGSGEPVGRGCQRAEGRLAGYVVHCFGRGLRSRALLRNGSLDFSRDIPMYKYNLWNGNTDDVNNRVTKGLCEIAMITAPYNTEEFHVLAGL
ncbi:MAG: LysR family transcriptional regulator [Oscillibacter sp.]